MFKKGAPQNARRWSQNEVTQSRVKEGGGYFVGKRRRLRKLQSMRRLATLTEAVAKRRRGDVFGFDIDDPSWKMAIQASRCLPANSSSAFLSANTYNSLAAYAKNKAEKAKLAFANFGSVSVAA